MLRLAIALFLVQAGFHGYTASLPLALSRTGVAAPEIGLIVGVAPLLIVIGTLATGPLIDRLGALRMFGVGAAAYVLGAAILAVPALQDAGASWPFVLARILQGAGYAAAAPAVLSVVPAMVPPKRQGVALAVAGTAQTLTLVVLPPLSIAALDIGGLQAVAVLVAACIAAAVLLMRTVRLPARAAQAAGARRFGLSFRRAWAIPLLVMFLYTIHWGVAVAYVPARADAVGANVGLFFVVDGILVVLFRIPSGWLADRVPSGRLVLVGLGLTSIAIVLLIQQPTTLLLALAGGFLGAGAGFLSTPLLVELGRRSSASNRGSAFALYSAAIAGAHATGSIVAAPLVALAGFEAAVLFAGIGVLFAAALTLSDEGLRRRGTQAWQGEPVQ
jgi:MFS family permease